MIEDIRGKIVFCLVLCIITLVLLSPFIWLVIQSFQTNLELTSIPPRIKPHQEDPFINYKALLLQKFPSRSQEAIDIAIPKEARIIPKAMINSVIVALSTVVLVLVFSFFPAYTFARFKFKYRNSLLFSIVVLRMFPVIILIVPLFVMVKKIGLINNLLSLIITYTGFLIPYAIWMLVAYFETIPVEIEESAIIEGCSNLQVIIKILLPLAKPGITAVAIFVAIMSWNEFLLASIFVSSIDLFTLPIVISTFNSNIQMVAYDYMITAGVIGTIAPIMFIFFLQRYIVGGLTGGAFK